MARKKQERAEIWWLAHGSKSRTRQPSFAPSTARPVRTAHFYRFGWHRTHQCFVTHRQFDITGRPFEKQFPCDPKVAAQLLRKCACVYMSKRFFKKPYAQATDKATFVFAGVSCHVSLSACRDNFRGGTIQAEAALGFNDPEGVQHTIGFHDGMTRSFGDRIADLQAADIRAHMR